MHTLNVQGLESAVSFGNLLFAFLQRQILYMEYPFWHLYGRTYKAQLSSEIGCLEAGFHLNKSLNAPLILKENSTLKCVFFTKETSDKII